MVSLSRGQSPGRIVSKLQLERRWIYGRLAFTVSADYGIEFRDS
jgi:hypothetical protein